MKITITNKNKNALLNRTEISFKVEDTKVPPSRKEVREKIAALENTKPEQTIVSKISHNFGSQDIEGTAKVYDSIEALEKIELEYMIGRNKGVKKGKEAAAEEAPAAPPKPEAAPEAKGEKKAEAKAEKEAPKAEEKKEAPAEEKKEEPKAKEKKEGDK
ncbi:MAG: hypothetical protein QGI60_03140 [archaeon]|jgi:ribosomal protein S24E|nr:hypothetical protein [archaeon]